MKRRSFLKLLASSAAVSSFPSIVRAETLGRNGGIAPSNRIAMGFIGLGGQGSLHLRNRLGNEFIQVVALCDVDGEQLRKAEDKVKEAGKPACFVTKDFRELLARPDVDAVLMALPDHWHALPVILAAQAGKDCYTEKPFSMTIPEGRAMVEAVRRSRIVCQVGSQQRSAANFRRLVELVRTGALGEIKRVQVGMPGRYNVPKLTAPVPPQETPADFDYEMWLGPAPWAPYYKERCRNNFRYNYDYSGGSLTDWVGHHFDIAQWAIGKGESGPVAIRNAKAEFWDSPLYNTPKSYSFEAHYDNGVVIEVANQDTDGHYAMGEIFDDSDGGVSIEGTEGWVKAGRARTAFSSPRLQTMPLPSQGFRLDGNQGHMDNFIECIKTRETPHCPAEEGHRSASVAHLANLAFRTGCSELKWNPDAEILIDAPDAERLIARAYRAPWQLPC
jgi:predicted dehydrogenase